MRFCTACIGAHCFFYSAVSLLDHLLFIDIYPVPSCPVTVTINEDICCNAAWPRVLQLYSNVRHHEYVKNCVMQLTRQVVLLHHQQR